MIEALLKEKAKEAARRTAGAIVAARLASERASLKRDSGRQIDAARAGQSAALAALNGRAGQGLPGEAGKVLAERAGTVRTKAYHRAGVEGVA